MGSLALALAPGPLPVPKACPAPGTAVEEEAVMQSHHYFIFLLKELVQDKWAVPSPAAAEISGMPAGSLSHPWLLHLSLSSSHHDIAASNTL